MKTCIDCIPCFFRQALEAARLVSDDEAVAEHVLRSVAALVKDLDMDQSPPEMGQKIHRIVRERVGMDDPYRGIKQTFNEAALKLYPEMRRLIGASEEPLGTAVRLAIAGNIIDFGVNGGVQDGDLERSIRQCLAAHFADGQLAAFKRAVNEAEDILYLADNAGEIVFDRLLIELLPVERVTVAVKGRPIINDATMEDAIVAGLPQIVEVIDNGDDAPGTVAEACCQEFRRRFARADLVIAKGQGNFETLSEADKHIFFILRAKCPVIAMHLACPIGTSVLLEHKASERRLVN
ncbi:MAG TPA: ARMT1-like domain-containing protein [Anaerohalosphaeraceae bacterium]|nr:ARMT1-like domain-containing protein [Anaerohalosphaeraceae bacterium]HRT52255.1 ARMT1-like domain-containing protein [Anaerohalosphaeraceae bacterium]HRT87378.1 ARMT1-like domain-containing protein [Anaerohalosphaeraceae bacterium]